MDCMQTSGVLEGVELGQFIMKTQMGRIFRGMYAGECVTVKVAPGSPTLVCHTACTMKLLTESQNM